MGFYFADTLDYHFSYKKLLDLVLNQPLVLLHQQFNTKYNYNIIYQLVFENILQNRWITSRQLLLLFVIALLLPLSCHYCYRVLLIEIPYGSCKLQFNKIEVVQKCSKVVEGVSTKQQLWGSTVARSSPATEEMLKIITLASTEEMLKVISLLPPEEVLKIISSASAEEVF